MAKVDRAVYSQRQLEAVMEDFWFNHFNVFANKGADRWFLTSYVRDTIRPRTMGKFDDLLIATAKSPAMLFFLDNWQSVDPDAFQRWRQQAESRRRFQGMFGGGFGPMPGEFPRPGARIPGFPAPASGAAAGGARPQRKLRPRGDGASHGRRGCRLHAAGRDRDGQMSHRLDHSRAAARSRIRVQARVSRARQESRDGPHL